LEPVDNHSYVNTANSILSSFCMGRLLVEPGNVVLKEAQMRDHDNMPLLNLNDDNAVEKAMA